MEHYLTLQKENDEIRDKGKRMQKENEELKDQVQSLQKENDELKEKLHRSDTYLDCWKESQDAAGKYGGACSRCGGLDPHNHRGYGGCRCCERCFQIPAFCKCKCDECNLYKYKDAGYDGNDGNEDKHYRSEEFCDCLPCDICELYKYKGQELCSCEG